MPLFLWMVRTKQHEMHVALATRMIALCSFPSLGSSCLVCEEGDNNNPHCFIA